MRWSGCVLVMLLGALGSGCGDDAAQPCSGANANNNCAEDAGSDGPQACAVSEECAAPTPVCDVTGTKTCVQCTADEAAACTGAMPVCGDDQACRACAAHAECGAETCLPDGACAAETDVAYVAPAGSGSACTKAAPCKTLAAAVSAARPYIKIAAGLIEDVQVTTIDAQAVTILADPGAKLDRTGDGAVLVVRNSGADVAIYDLEIGGATGVSGGNGIELQSSGGSPQLRLTRVKVAGNQGAGITTNGGSLTVTQSTISTNQGVGIAGGGGSLTVTQSTISANQGGGITASGGSLTVTQSTISANQSGGITASDGSLTVTQSTISTNQGTGITMGATGVVTLTNNFIFRNGNASTASAGGLSVRPMGASRIEFNTIVDNQATVGAASAGGVFCDEAGFIAANNLIFRNTGGLTGAIQTFGICTYGNSFNMAGASVVDNAVGFANPNTVPFDYHLTAASPATVLDAGGSCTGVDFDGEPRPAGGGCDLGADEYTP